MLDEDLRGFHISIDMTARIIDIRLWGRWNLNLGKEYSKELLKQIDTVKNNGEDWLLLLDLTHYPAQALEVQHLIQERCMLLKDYSIYKSAIIVNGIIPQFVKEGFSQDAGQHISSYFQSKDAAVRWLQGK